MGDELVVASDVSALIIKWSTGWPKVDVEMAESSSCCSDELVQVPPEFYYGTQAPSLIPPNMMFAAQEWRSVEWAEQSAREFEERMQALLVEPTDAIQWCRGSRKAKLFDLPANAKYEYTPFSTAKAQKECAAPYWWALTSSF